MISFAWKNCKLELLLIALAIIWVNLSWRIPNLNQILEDYFSESRCSGIAGFTSIVIGIYITIWSIFATSASKINAELLKSRIEGQLFFLIGIDLIEALLTTVLCVFVPSGISYYAELIALFTALTVVSFAKFIILIMIITKLNITYIVQEIDEQNAKCIESQVKTDEIYQRIVNAKK
jgi:hypothetical protein